MTEIYLSAVIPAPIGEVWKVVGDYAHIFEWHPVVEKTVMKEGPAADEVGSMRHCTLADGTQILERQTARSDDEYYYGYTITDDSPMPMTNHEATVRLREITDGDRTLMEWHTRLDPDPGAEDEMPAMMRQALWAGFESIKARFDTSG